MAHLIMGYISNVSLWSHCFFLFIIIIIIIIIIAVFLFCFVLSRRNRRTLAVEITTDRESKVVHKFAVVSTYAFSPFLLCVRTDLFSLFLFLFLFLFLSFRSLSLFSPLFLRILIPSNGSPAQECF